MRKALETSAVPEGERVAIANLRPDIARLFATDDGAEGVRSFVERRDAQFVGR